MRVLKYGDAGYYPVEFSEVVLRRPSHLVMTNLIETLLGTGVLTINEVKDVVGGDWQTVDELPDCWKKDFPPDDDWLTAPTPTPASDLNAMFE